LDGLPIETAPENERIQVWHPIFKRWVHGIHYTKTYHNRSITGWRVSIHPADRWAWISFAPKRWAPLPEPPCE
jgi:hypothetical protein